MIDLTLKRHAVGVVNSLAKRGEIVAQSDLFGRALEHWVVLEMRAYLSYSRSDLEMSYWRSLSQFEVDLLVGNQIAIEVKGTSLVQDKHLKGLRALKEEKIFKKHIVVSLDPRARVTEDGIEILPWKKYVERLWAGDLI
jgi:predicted AAA+ superfamily ATPase